MASTSGGLTPRTPATVTAKGLWKQTVQSDARLRRRRKTNFPFGTVQPLRTTQLPTALDIICAYDDGKNSSCLRYTSRNDKSKVIHQLGQTTLDIWKKASIPTIKDHSVEMKIMRMIDAMFDKPFKLKEKQKADPGFMTAKCKNIDKLFDIAKCGCYRGCQNMEEAQQVKCQCQPSHKIPEKEIPYYLDQKSERKLYISSVDLTAAKGVREREQRKIAQEERQLLEGKRVQDETDRSRSTIVTESSNASYSSDQSDIFPPDNSEEVMKQGNKINLEEFPNTMMIAKRYNASTRQTAAFINAVLQDLNMATTENLVSRKKVRNMMDRYGKKEARINKEKKGLLCIKFDGRKDKTLQDGNRFSQEEHVTVVAEPGGQNIDHFTPSSGEGRDIANEIVAILDEHDSQSTLQAMGADGTSVNTGKFNGVIRITEERLQCPLQWIICLLHFNELPLRKLFEYYDGQTSGPQTFKGSLGKLIQNFKVLPILNYQPVRGSVSEVEDGLWNNLSNDQCYLIKIALFIQPGPQSFPPSFMMRHPGPVHHARWVTKASCLLCLYAQEENPTHPLQHLVGFILKVYVPSFVQIK